MSLNRKLSGGLKRPKATDFVDSDSKRNRSDESGPGEGNLPPKTPPLRVNTYPEPGAYSRRDFPERRNSEDSHFIRPGAAPTSRKSSFQSQGSLPLNGHSIPTGPRVKVPSPPLSNRTPSTEYFTAASVASSHAASGRDTLTGPNPAYNVRPSSPAPVQTHFSDNDSIRSGSFDVTTGPVAPVAPMMDHSVLNSPRSANAVLDIRKRPAGSSNLHTVPEGAASTSSTPMASSSPHLEDLPRRRSEAKARQEKAQGEVNRLKTKVDKLKGSTSTAKAKVEKDLAQAISNLQAAEDKVNKLEMSTRIHEPPQAVDQNVSKPNSAIVNLETSKSEPTLSILQGRPDGDDGQQKVVAELQQQLVTVSEELAREKVERERENAERDRQFALLQGQFHKFLTTKETEKQDQEQEQRDREKEIEERFRREKEALQRHVKDTVRDNNKLTKDIIDLYKRLNDFKHEARTEIAKAPEGVNLLIKQVEDINAWKANTNVSLSHINQDLSGITKDVNTIRTQFNESQVKPDNTPLLDPSAITRLNTLEAFQNSATQSMNNMSAGLKGATRPDDLDVLQKSLTNVAYDAAKEEAKDVFNKLTARIDTLENGVVPDEGVKARVAACEAELTKVVKWVGQRPEDNPDVMTLTNMVANLVKDIDGTPNLSDDHEDKVEGITDIVARCEEAVGNLSTRVEEKITELEKPKPEQEEPETNNRIQVIDAKISSLKSEVENQRLFFEGQAKSTFNGLEKKIETTISSFQSYKNEFSSQLPSLQKELQQERAARVDLENRVRGFGQSSLSANIGPLRNEFEAVKQAVTFLENQTSEQIRQVFLQIQILNPEAIRKDLKDVYDRVRVAQTGLQNLEGRYNAITTTSLVQKMLDQVHNLMPPGTDLISVIRDLRQHQEQIRRITDELKEMSDKLALSNNRGIDDTAMLNRAVETYTQIVEAYKQKAEGLEGRQKAIIEKLSDLQYQLGLDDEALNGESTLREIMENSMKDLREGIQQMSPAQGQSSGVSEDAIKRNFEKLQGIVDRDHKLVNEEQTRLNQRVNLLEEESSKASTVSPLDPTRFAKKAHVDELKDTVLKHGMRLERLESMKSADAGANESDSEDARPLLTRRKSNAPMMGHHPVEGPHTLANSPRQRNFNKSRKHGPAQRSSIADSEDER